MECIFMQKTVAISKLQNKKIQNEITLHKKNLGQISVFL